jgi:MFS family permease
MNTPSNQYAPDSSEPQKNNKRIYFWDRKNQKGNREYLSLLLGSIAMNFEYILSVSISAILLVLAFLTDQPAIFILAIIVAPNFYSVIGFSIGFELASLRFLKTALFTWLVSFFVYILSGTFAGFIARQFPDKEFEIWKGYLETSWANIVLLAIGVIFLITIYIRNPKPKSIVANVAISYVLILPLAASGFALGNGLFDLFVTGIKSYLILFGIAVVIGIVTLFVSGIRPQMQKIWSPLVLIFLFLIGSIFYLTNIQLLKSPGTKNINEKPVNLSNPEDLSFYISPTISISEATKFPERTESITEFAVIASSTPTIPATNTPTITLTPLPTPVWAEIQAVEANGANIRAEPGFSGKIIRSVLNGTLVEVLPDVEVVDNITWANIRFSDQTMGWIVRTLLLSATPAPEW